MWPFSRKHFRQPSHLPIDQEAAVETKTWRAGCFALSLPSEYTLARHHSCETENRNFWVDLPFAPLYPAPLQPDFDPSSEVFPDPPGIPPPSPPPPPLRKPTTPRKRPMVQQDAWSWQGTGEHAIELIVWTPEPPSDGGPMRAVAEWTGTIAGAAVHVSETALFMGLNQRVIVAHISLVAPKGTCLFYARGLNRPEFTAILDSIELHGNQIQSQQIKSQQIQSQQIKPPQPSDRK
jgi:hypothetical protein